MKNKLKKISKFTGKALLSTLIIFNVNNHVDANSPELNVYSQMYPPFILNTSNGSSYNYHNLTSTMLLGITGAGVNNYINSSNTSVVFGLGNLLTHSFKPIPLDRTLPNNQNIVNYSNTNTLNESTFLPYTKAINYGGRVYMAGLSNVASNIVNSQIVGSGNNATGTDTNNIDNLILYGNDNKVENSNNNIIFTNNRKLSSVNNSIILGYSDQEIQDTNKDFVTIVHNSKTLVDGGIALGSNSLANTNKGIAGYSILTNSPSTNTSPTWQAT